MFSKTISVISLTLYVCFERIMCTILVNKQITVQIISKGPKQLLDSGKGSTKFIPIPSQGLLGTRSRCNKPNSFWLLGLLILHVWHESQ